MENTYEVYLKEAKKGENKRTILKSLYILKMNNGQHKF